jgi:hypothetical protein
MPVRTPDVKTSVDRWDDWAKKAALSEPSDPLRPATYADEEADAQVLARMLARISETTTPADGRQSTLSAWEMYRRCPRPHDRCVEGGQMAMLEISAWRRDDYDANRAPVGYKQRCGWGGSSCAEPAEFTVTDRAGARNSACPAHLLKFVRDRVTKE